MSKKSKTIICIEANAINRYMIKKLLESEGHHVYDAETKEAGLGLVEGIVPDLILIDLHMPGVDGYAITQHIRAISGFENVPIIALTTHVGVDGYSKTPISGCEGAIQKPIDAQLFVNNVGQFFS